MKRRPYGSRVDDESRCARVLRDRFPNDEWQDFLFDDGLMAKVMLNISQAGSHAGARKGVPWSPEARASHMKRLTMKANA
jgi:hypothetical protein